MSLNYLVEWAHKNNVDFDKKIEIGGWDGLGILTTGMISKREDDGIDLDSSEI